MSFKKSRGSEDVTEVRKEVTPQSNSSQNTTRSSANDCSQSGHLRCRICQYQAYLAQRTNEIDS